MNLNGPPIAVSALAFQKFVELIDERKRKGKPTLGIRIKLLSKGCGGNEYGMEYVEEAEQCDEMLELAQPPMGKVSLFVDPKTMLRIIGTKIDYEETKFKSGFVFKNPREKGRCGCGKSFYY
ncbi:HesB/IscA family protein [Neorickettsia sennetsu]|uniref:Iron-sulfur cluster assembly accessory protein n=1 Tax=Ehrlichia sennetsu (strain ATCC VR-367 / Miyayama) TaxID=222891 RepID=Q2GEA5_EHRS3|nr:iron-sulfur cluster assembly accessory protein [Neorickettsia sennetsu]ABD45753.1 iron-sulfur cluster assembly accessory protein [Neorickettsia sennetsu str. Miyayama]